MKIALLIPVHNIVSDKWSYEWGTPSERTISERYTTVAEALQNKPQGYICKNDGWNNI